MLPNETASQQADDWGSAPQWEWRKCRNVGFKLAFWPLDWRLYLSTTWSDEFAWTREWHIGPFGFEVLCNVGWNNA